MTQFAMQESGNYRVIDRRIFAIIMVALLGVISVAAWLGLDRIADYFEQLERLAGTDPHAATAAISRLVRTLAIVNGIVLSSLAALLIRYGWKGLRTASMPPKGAWILEGQRSWSGEAAVRIARFMMAVGGLLGILAAASSLILWNLGSDLPLQ